MAQTNLLETTAKDGLLPIVEAVRNDIHNLQIRAANSDLKIILLNVQNRELFEQQNAHQNHVHEIIEQYQTQLNQTNVRIDNLMDERFRVLGQQEVRINNLSVAILALNQQPTITTSTSESSIGQQIFVNDGPLAPANI